MPQIGLEFGPRQVLQSVFTQAIEANQGIDKTYQYQIGQQTHHSGDQCREDELDELVVVEGAGRLERAYDTEVAIKEVIGKEGRHNAEGQHDINEILRQRFPVLAQEPEGVGQFLGECTLTIKLNLWLILLHDDFLNMVKQYNNRQ